MEINWTKINAIAAAEATALGHPPHVVDDVVQETALRILVLKASNRLRMDTVCGLAKRTAANLAIDGYRRAPPFVPLDPERHLGSTQAPPADDLLRAAVTRIIDRYPKLYLGAFYILSGLTMRDVGAMFDLSYVTVYQRVHKFLDEIRKEVGIDPKGKNE